MKTYKSSAYIYVYFFPQNSSKQSVSVCRAVFEENGFSLYADIDDGYSYIDTESDSYYEDMFAEEAIKRLKAVLVPLFSEHDYKLSVTNSYFVTTGFSNSKRVFVRCDITKEVEADFDTLFSNLNNCIDNSTNKLNDINSNVVNLNNAISNFNSNMNDSLDKLTELFDIAFIMHDSSNVKFSSLSGLSENFSTSNVSGRSLKHSILRLCDLLSATRVADGSDFTSFQNKLLLRLCSALSSVSSKTTSDAVQQITDNSYLKKIADELQDRTNVNNVDVYPLIEANIDVPFEVKHLNKKEQ